MDMFLRALEHYSSMSSGPDSIHDWLFSDFHLKMRSFEHPYTVYMKRELDPNCSERSSYPNFETRQELLPCRWLLT
jgi:hypothetical protein